MTSNAAAPQREKTHPHFTVHVTDALAEKIRQRARGFPSVNAYLIHAITMEMSQDDSSRVDMEIAAAVRRVVELASR